MLCDKITAVIVPANSFLRILSCNFVAGVDAIPKPQLGGIATMFWSQHWRIKFLKNSVLYLVPTSMLLLQ